MIGIIPIVDSVESIPATYVKVEGFNEDNIPFGNVVDIPKENLWGYAGPYVLQIPECTPENIAKGLFPLHDPTLELGWELYVPPEMVEQFTYPPPPEVDRLVEY